MFPTITTHPPIHHSSIQYQYYHEKNIHISAHKEIKQSPNHTTIKICGTDVLYPPRSMEQIYPLLC